MPEMFKKEPFENLVDFECFSQVLFEMRSFTLNLHADFNIEKERIECVKDLYISLVKRSVIKTHV